MSAQPAYRLHSEPIAETDEFAEVLEGLRRQNKRIEPRFFYDERGSELFTEITRQPEYYPTRTEMSLLQYLAADLRNLAGEGCTLIEYGSGSSEKIRILLESLKPAIYAPLDISKDYLVQAADNIGREYPWLDVQAICVDYTKSFDLPAQFGAPSGEQATGKKLGFFPGSSIGNFSPEAALAFLQLIRQQLGNGGALLIGVDLKKSTEVLNQAYNDAA
ncbi:MAG: L-histidine N(alpha)-methyltransferase, partial [Pseudomonadales bacterium]|nr:L-histidine N(alpha)-methyltransferase [Pseudomonadales bacterium]